MLYDWDNIAEREVVPGMHGRFIHSGGMTFALWRIDAGTALPRHNHPHEQVVQVRSGELELVLDRETHLLTPGTVLVIPPDVPHHGYAKSAVEVLDTFTPVREDYRDGAPSVLAQAAAASR
jgi:quercetin dioxygenase-like cupin family protein